MKYNKNYLENSREDTKWENNIKMRLRETGSEEGKWIGLVLTRNQTKSMNWVTSSTKKKRETHSNFPS
jgi:hypothetical protein